MPHRILIFLILVVTSWLLFSHCANPIGLGGGPRDTSPPKLIEERSTPNYQTNFEKQDIYLYFDEFVQLSDVNKYVVVSPPLNYIPRIEARAQSVELSFDEFEVLKDNATYVINFGEAIRDFNESNPLPNFRFIFSTGDYIDSLAVSGMVIDAYTGEPVEQVHVMLYDETRDSVVYQQRPFYFSSTDKSGQFRIENIRSDSFKVFALKDANLNYLYDQQSESIGFLDSLIFVNDTTDISLKIKMFVEKQPFGLEELKTENYGLVLLNFTGDASEIQLETSLNHQFFQNRISYQSNDSIWFWYDVPVDTNFAIYLTDNKEYYDTLQIRRTNRSRFVSNNSLKISIGNLENRGLLSPYSNLRIDFSYPVVRLNSELIHLYSDTLEDRVAFQILTDSMDFRSMTVIADWKQDSSYILVIDSSAITDMFGLTQDSLMQDFTINNAEAYGTIKVLYDDFLTDRQYVVNLIRGGKIITKRIIKETSGTLEFPHLPSGQYSLEIIEDQNFNGTWDPGNYLMNRQPERVQKVELENLRANWELEKTLNSSIFTE